jgi:NifB/MoaA-like Fe-S oxidoreductase
MSAPRVVAVAPGSPADRAGIVEGDEVASVNGEVPRDLLEWRELVDAADVALDVRRGGLEQLVEVAKRPGEPLGVEVGSALFDRVRTCDNHCEFCFIYQLPPGLRRSLYMKDDDYRLSFLYGNFTTLTRFTEADLERVVTEKLSPLYVSIHATDPAVRAGMLRNRRGATSLRWLRALLDHGVEVHGQVVVCPGVNDGAVLDDTLAGVLDRYPELASLCIVPLGVSRHSSEERMRPHTRREAEAIVDAVADWQQVYAAVLGRRLAYAADEYYLLGDRPFPPATDYGDYPMHEDGIGMVRAFESELLAGDGPPGATGVLADGAASGGAASLARDRGGFFRSVDGDVSRSTASDYEPYRAVRATDDQLLSVAPSRKAPVAVLTGPYGARVLAPLLERLGLPDVRIVIVDNHYLGGNIGVAGLMVGGDLARVLADQPEGQRYLLPDVCLTNGRFLDGMEPSALPRPVEIVRTDGRALRAALGLPAVPGRARPARDPRVAAAVGGCDAALAGASGSVTAPVAAPTTPASVAAEA